MVSRTQKVIASDLRLKDRELPDFLSGEAAVLVRRLSGSSHPREHIRLDPMDSETYSIDPQSATRIEKEVYARTLDQRVYWDCDFETNTAQIYGTGGAGGSSTRVTDYAYNGGASLRMQTAIAQTWTTHALLFTPPSHRFSLEYYWMNVTIGNVNTFFVYLVGQLMDNFAWQCELDFTPGAPGDLSVFESAALHSHLAWSPVSQQWNRVRFLIDLNVNPMIEQVYFNAIKLLREPIPINPIAGGTNWSDYMRIDWEVVANAAVQAEIYLDHITLTDEGDGV